MTSDFEPSQVNRSESSATGKPAGPANVPPLFRRAAYRLSSQGNVKAAAEVYRFGERLAASGLLPEEDREANSLQPNESMGVWLTRINRTKQNTPVNAPCKNWHRPFYFF